MYQSDHTRVARETRFASGDADIALGIRMPLAMRDRTRGRLIDLRSM